MCYPPGSRLGTYEILAPLGAGGMGEVYRGRDPRLDRDVAIKVLPPEFAHDADRRMRFEREARTLAALSHPNIVTIHDVGAESGVSFVVMELLDGETLRGVLTRTRLPLRKTLNYAVQLARGLASAHERGCVHRDLKPENIFITRDGQLKILDFGIARIVQAEPGADVTTPPTRTMGTDPGVVLGTIGYMSPEQVQGRPADARSDLFAFGAIVYEMIAGRRAFTGDSPAATISALLRDDPPPLKAGPDGAPANMQRIVFRCLEKNPDARLRSAHDLAFQLESLSLESTDRLTAVDSSGNRFRWTGFLGVAGLVVVSTFLWLQSGRARAGGPSASDSAGLVSRTTILLPPDETIALARTVPYGIGRPSLALSPDGRHLAYVVEQGDRRSLRVRPLDQWEAKAIAGTDGAFGPFFSPNGEWIGFFTDTHLKKVFRDGGAPITLCPATNAFGAAWAADDTITFVQQEARTLTRIPAAGGGAPVDVLSSETYAWQWPHALGRNLLIGSQIWGTAGVEVLRPNASTTERLLSEGSAPQLSPETGHLIVTGEGVIMAAPFDMASATVRGALRPVLEGVRTESDGHGQFAFSRNGTLAYVAGGSARHGRLVWSDRRGITTPIADSPVRAYGTPVVSADGRRIAVVVYESGRRVWTHDASTGGWTRLSFDGETAGPFWSADGQDLFFVGIRAGQSSIYRSRVGTTSPAQEIIRGGRHGGPAFKAGLRRVCDGRHSGRYRRLFGRDRDIDASDRCRGKRVLSGVVAGRKSACLYVG